MNQPTRLFDFPYFQMDNFPMEVSMSSKAHGVQRSYSTVEFIDHLNKISRGLLRLGVQQGDKIALISHNNRCEWNIMDHGVLQIGAIDVPIYRTMSAEDYVYILNHSESKYCFVSNDELATKVMSIKDQVPSLIEVYSFERVQGVKNWEEVLELGTDDSNQTDVEAIKKGVKAEDLAAKIEVSRRCVYDIINVMKSMGAPIEYCTTRQSYYYEYECEPMIGFMEKVRGGKNKNSELFFDSAIFLHNPLIPLQHNHDYRDILRTL